MLISDIAQSVARFVGSLTLTMRRRLVMFTVALALFVGVIIMAVIMLFGRFSIVEQRISDALSSALSVYERDITDYFDHLAAQGIKMSEELSVALGEWQKIEGIAFADLSGNPDVIERMEEFLYSTLHRSLELANCSGAYFLLDITANPALPDAAGSKCGLYIKVVNLSASRPVDPQIALYRGCSPVGSRNSLPFHNMWALEFLADDLPGYETVMGNAGANLNKCFLYTDSFRLPGTWENVMLLYVPIMGADGEALGLCGFEISGLYYKLQHAQTEIMPHMTGLLTRRTDGGLDADSGFESGCRSGYFIELTGTFDSTSGKYFSLYSGTESAFVGMETPVQLSPLEEIRTVAVMLPKEDYDDAAGRNLRENIVIILLVLLTAVFGSIFMSRMYIAPILRGLSQAQSGSFPPGGTNIREIDDLMEHLSELDAEREALAAEIERLQSTPLPKGADSLPDLTAYTEFVRRLETLTSTERRVFDLYMHEKTVDDIAKELFISKNTVKFHNRNIYAKLGVTSSKELLVYARMMRETYPSASEAH